MRTLFLVIVLFLNARSHSEEIKLLRMGMVGEPATLNPVFRSSSEEGLINALALRSLSHFNAHSELVPHIAIKEPKFVGNELIFEIKKEARWGDGVPMTCEDFNTGNSAALKFHVESETKIVRIASFPGFPQQCRVMFRIKKPIYTLYLAQPLPSHIESRIVNQSKDIEEYLKRTMYSTKPMTPGLYNGPYILSLYMPGSHLEYTRNPLFYGHTSRIEKIQVRIFKDFQGMLNAFRTQEIDMMMQGVPSSRVKEIQKIIDEKNWPYRVVSRDITKLTHLVFNLESPNVKDVRVRRALSMMIDVKEFKDVVNGNGTLTGSLAHPLDPIFLKQYTRPLYKLDRKKAMSLLKEAGFTRNSENKLVGSSGKQLEIRLHFNSENPDREDVAMYLENKWSSLGINVSIKKSLKRVLMGEYLKKGNYDVAVFGWSQPKLQINLDFFTSQAIPTEANKWIGYNYARWNNLKVDQEMTKADAEFEISGIKKHMDAFQKEFREDLPWLPLYFQDRIVVVPKYLKSFEIFPDWEAETYSIENW
ncbi:MAG: hypothetical protein JNL11_14555 [Bdellovibrionaceae bacterium]|nr:hypothetical protein [Pseudobdellovibrionaceae bacterium]